MAGLVPGLIPSFIPKEIGLEGLEVLIKTLGENYAEFSNMYAMTLVYVGDSKNEEDLQNNFHYVEFKSRYQTVSFFKEKL